MIFRLEEGIWYIQVYRSMYIHIYIRAPTYNQFPSPNILSLAFPLRRKKQHQQQSKFLLPKMLRLMTRLKINMHIRPLHMRQTLQLNLQRLRHIMRLPQRASLIHNNIHLNNNPRSTMIRPDSINSDDIRRMRHGDVRDPLLHLRVGGDADEELEFAVGGGEPEVGD